NSFGMTNVNIGLLCRGMISSPQPTLYTDITPLTTVTDITYSGYAERIKWRGEEHIMSGEAKNIAVARVTIRGVRPILFHRFGPEALPLEKQERTGVAGNDPEEWKRTVIATKEGQLYLPPEYIFACLREAAKYTKKGRGSIQPLVAATLQVIENKVLLDRWLPDGLNSLSTDDSEPVYLDIRGVRNPASR